MYIFKYMTYYSLSNASGTLPTINISTYISFTVGNTRTCADTMHHKQMKNVIFILTELEIYYQLLI